MLDRVDILTYAQKMDATLFPPKETSVWRQEPIPEIDAL
jgi:hypothetical protein